MILVVGGTGQVGFAVLRGLRRRGKTVAALLRTGTSSTAIARTGAHVLRGDLRDPASLERVCEGAECLVATANTIVPRAGERGDFDAIARGYQWLGRAARSAGVRRFVFISIPREFMGRGAPDFDAKARIEQALSAEGPPLVVVRASLIMETWLPWLGSRLALRGQEHPTLERGSRFVRLGGAAFHHSLDWLGIALLPGDGTARHAFITSDDVAECLVATALASDDQLGDELLLGGPEILSWREVAAAYGRVKGVPIRTLHQPAIVYRALLSVARIASATATQIFASQGITATVDSAYPADHARQLLGREPMSVEAFLRHCSSLPSPVPDHT